MPYTNSNIEVMAGGYGYAVVNGATGLTADYTSVDFNRPIQAAGTLNQFQMRCWSASATATDNAKLKIFRGSNLAAMTLVYDIDITTAINAVKAVGRFTLDLDLTGTTYTVQQGDYVGFYFGPTNPIYPIQTTPTFSAPGITNANPGVCTITGHGFANDDKVKVTNVNGMTEVNGNTYTVANATANTFELSGTNTTGFGTWTSGGWADYGVGAYQAPTTGDKTTSTVDVSASNRMARLVWDITVDTNEYVWLDDDNAAVGFSTGDLVNLPAGISDNYYLILEGVLVPDTELLDIHLDHTDTSAANITTKTITLDFTGGGNDDKISWDGFANSKTLQTAGSVSMAGRKINLHLWSNPTDDKGELIFCSYDEGMGPQGDRDIQHLSITDRVNASFASGGGTIKRVRFNQTTGSAASIDRVIVTRKPVLVVGDSFTSTYSTVTSLNRIGALLDDAGVFTEQRYVINGGITGGRLLTDASTIYTATKTRWNDAAGNQDMVGYQDVVVVLVNGMSLNDIAGPVNTEAKYKEFSAAIAGAMGTMIGDCLSSDAAKGGVNDVVASSMIQYENSVLANQWNKLVITKLNDTLQNLCHAARVPYANLLPYGLGYDDDGTHPLTPSGNQWIADQIVRAYELNKIPDLDVSNISTTVGVLGGVATTIH